MEKKTSNCSKMMLLLISMMIVAASAQTTVVYMPFSEKEMGSGLGSSDEIILPYTSQLDSSFFATSSTEQTVFSSSTVIPVPTLISSKALTSTASSLFTASSNILIPSSSVMFLSISSTSASSTPLSLMVSPSSSPLSTPTPTPTFTQALTVVSSLTSSSLSSSIGIQIATLPRDPATSSSANLTPMPMVDDSSEGSLPLPVLIAVPLGAVVLISVLFILVVICCMRCRKRRKYTLSSKNNRLSDYAPRSVSPEAPDIESNTDSKKHVSKFEDVVADTLAMEFPDTPKYDSNEDIPALIILNPVKPNVEPVSNSLWSQTLPSRHKVRKNTCSESDVPDGLESSLLKPAKSTSAIDTLTLSTEITNKSVDDGTSMTLLLPESKKRTSARKNDRNDYDHLLSEEEFLQAAALEVDGDPNSLGSTGYVFLEPANSASERKPTDSSAPDHDVDLKAKKDLQPSSMPIPIQPPQHTLPTDFSVATAETESIYDTPKSTGIDIFSPKESKQSTSSGSCSSAKDITSSIETPSHYDVPKSALLAYREEAARQLGSSVQPNAALGAAQEASLSRLNSAQECYYDSLGSRAGSLRPRSHSPPYYDIPKLLLQTKNKAQTLDKSEDSLVQETNVDELESSEEHVYCVPPDVAVNNLKSQKSRAEVSKTDSTKIVSTSPSKPVPKKRQKNEKNEDTLRDSVVPAPRKVADLSSISSSQEELLDKPEPKNDATTGLIPQPSKRTKKPTKDGSGAITRSQKEVLDKPESKHDAKTNAVPAPGLVKKSINSSANSQEKLMDEPEAKGNANAKVEPAPRPVKKSTSNSSGFVTISQEKLLDKPEPKGIVTKVVPAPRLLKKSTSNSSGFITGSQEKLPSKPEAKGSTVSTNVELAPRPVKKSTSNSSGFVPKPESLGDVNADTTSGKKLASNSSDSGVSSQEKLPDKSESKSDVSANAVPATRPAKLSMLNDLPGSGATKQLLRELKSLSGTTASPIPKPILKKFNKTSPSNEQEKQITNDMSPGTTSRPLAKKPAKLPLGSMETKNGMTNVHPPTVSTKPTTKTKASPRSITSSTENLMKASESKSTNSASTSSPARSSKPIIKKHTRGKSSSDIVATPGPMVAKEPGTKGDAANVAPAPKPAVAKKSALLARTASLEDLLSKPNNNVVRPGSPKPAVGKKPAIQAKISSSSTTGSLDDLLNQSELRNNRAAPPRPAVAKKPTSLGLAAKKSTSSVSSSAEDLLSTPESRKAPGLQSVTVNGNGPDSPLCESPPLVDRLDVHRGTGDKIKQKSKPKPKIIPRSGSRHAIVQEQGEAAVNSNLPSPSTGSPMRAPMVPTRPSQRPPPIPQRPEQKPPINA